MIHETAVIHPSARIGEGARIGAYARVGAYARIAEGASIGEGARVGASARIDEGAHIGEGASTDEGARVGAYASIGEGAIMVTGLLGGGGVVGPKSKFICDLGAADGYRKVLCNLNGVAYIGAGCRWFCLDDALNHWSAKPDRKMTMALMLSAEQIARDMGLAFSHYKKETHHAGK